MSREAAEKLFTGTPASPSVKGDRPTPKTKRVKRAPGSAQVGRGATKAKKDRTAPAPKNRTGKDKQEMVVNYDELHTRIPNLEKLLRAAQEAGQAFSDGVKATAEKAGLKAGWVRSLVTARVGDTFKEKKRDVDQMQLLFDEFDK